MAGGAASVMRQLLLVELADQGLLAVAGDDAAAVDDRDPVAELLGLLEIVRGQHDGDAAAVELLHVGPERRRSSTSTPAVGSSRITTGGRWTSALATRSRRRMPPDSERA